ncbi:MAG TPA: hypothetical protein EYP43_01935 [Thermoplasmata archaeon]|nr:hypothetical protein [Thermoplasmata archaeon]
MSLKDLPFGIVMIVRAEALMALLHLIGGLVLYVYAPSLSTTPTLFAAYGAATMRMVGTILAAIGMLDALCALALRSGSAGGLIVGMTSALLSLSATLFLLTLGFLAGLMNLAVNVAVPLYLMRWDVRQEYL